MAGSKAAASLIKKTMKMMAEYGGSDAWLHSAMKVEVASKGHLALSFLVSKEHTNLSGNLHGGCSAQLVDNVTTMALMIEDGGKPGVSVDMNINYLKGATVGQEVLVTAKTLKVGRTLAFTQCEITNKKTGALLVKGSHTKYVG